MSENVSSSVVSGSEDSAESPVLKKDGDDKWSIDRSGLADVTEKSDQDKKPYFRKANAEFRRGSDAIKVLVAIQPVVVAATILFYFLMWQGTYLRLLKMWSQIYCPITYPYFSRQ